jgi:hypothetical protein
MHGAGKRIGALDEELEAGIRLALTADRQACAEEGARYEWDRCTDLFLEGLAWRHGSGPRKGQPSALARGAKVAETA